MEKLTFKQYLDSKSQLLRAIENTPTAVYEYEVKKYCSLTLGETEEDQRLIGLKPRNRIVVEWRYDSIANPSPESIRLIGAKDIDEDEKLMTSWSGSKLTKWLTRHTKHGENNGHKI